MLEDIRRVELKHPALAKGIAKVPLEPCRHTKIIAVVRSYFVKHFRSFAHEMVAVLGLEPRTSRTQSAHSSQLSYTPSKNYNESKASPFARILYSIFPGIRRIWS